MADRIFPNRPDADMGSEKEFNGINADTLQSLLRQAEAGNADRRLAGGALEEFMGVVTDIYQGEYYENEDAPKRFAKKEIPEAFKKYIKRKKGEGDETEEADEDEDEKMEKKGSSDCDCCDKCPKCACKSCGCTDKKAKASVRQRKVRFSSLDQISVEALESARASGDHALAEAIMGARHARREELGKKIVAAGKKNSENQQKLAKRANYRLEIVASAEAAKKAVASSKPRAKKSAVASKSTTGNSAAGNISIAERKAFAEFARSNGFPEEYILAMVSQESAESEIETEVKEIMSSALPEKTRISAAKSLIRTSELSAEQVARQVRYWKDELGYGDQAWIDDLFSTKYNTHRTE